MYGSSSSPTYACIGLEHSFGRGAQDVFGFGDWSKQNCEMLFWAAIMNNCSIIETRGIKPKEPENEEAKLFKQQG